MRLVLVGPPGSGKGTQAEKLVKQLGLTYVGTGEILRAAIRAGTPMGKRVEPLMKQGLLVPDPEVNDVVAELFRSDRRPDCFVMDGYPRTYSQAIAFDALLRQQFLALDAVVNLTIPDDDVVKRISGRRCCSNPACGVCFNVHYKPPRDPMKCDKCGSPLVLRDDDKEETVRRRLGEFHKNTNALIEHYRKQNLVRDVSATDAPETIYQNIVKAIRAEKSV
ncbi:MAG TPA: nucleoside monophosphate kinase [Gemmata sp.]|nr:nucleoside monophosphate kinase [Gemmata sp.]